MPKLYLLLAVLALLGITNGVTAYKFFGFGKNVVQIKWDAANSVDANQKLTVKEKQNEVRNNRPDVDSAIKRMRKPSTW